MTARFSRVPIQAAADRRLGATELRVLIALGAFVGKGGQCWPSLATIARVAGLDRRKVPAAIGKLIAAGLVAKIASAAGRSATYQLDYELTPDEVSVLTPGEVSPDEATDTSGGDRVTPGEVSVTPLTDTSGGALTAQDSEQPNEQPNLSSPDTDNVMSEIDVACQDWNTMATEAGLPTVRKLTKPLRSSLRARLAECGGIEGWQAVLERIQQSEFLCGGGDRGWRANLKWLIKPGNVENVMAGNYDSRRKPRFTNGFAELLHDELNEDNRHGQHRQNRPGGHRAGAALAAAAELALEAD